ncbi:unnamed protein product [Ophioblennius macclurei]
MTPLRSFAPWLLLAFLAQQLPSSSAKRSKNITSTPSRYANGIIGKGRFVNNNNKLCLWHAAEVGNSVTIEVGCDPGAYNMSGLFAMQCRYQGQPQKCPMYGSSPKTFWKRVTRGLKKLLVKLCTDERALLQAPSCGRSQRDAHFKLNPRGTLILRPPSGAHVPYPRPSDSPAIPLSRPGAQRGQTHKLHVPRRAAENGGGVLQQRVAQLVLFLPLSGAE